MKTNTFLFVIILTIVLFFLPLLLKPQLFLQKDNDLGRTYIPIFNFFHNSVYEYGQIPLWRPEQLMGETFVGSPLSSLFYPGNIIFVILPVDIAVIIYIFSDFLLAAIFTYLLARSHNLSKLSSFSAALFYSLSAKMLVHLEAGHVTMLTAFAYFPLSFLALRKIIIEPSFAWIVIGSISLAFTYFCYPTVFYYSLIFLTLYWIYKNISLPKSRLIESSRSLLLVLAVTLGLSAIALFPQLEFGPLSTRSSLTLTDVAIPLWNFKKFLINLLFPYLSAQKVDHEEFLYLGIIPTIFAIKGFVHLKKNQKIILASFGLLTLAFVAGLSTPVFKLAYSFLPLLKYSRVTTRLWFVVALIAALLTASALERIKNKKIIFAALTIFIFESAFIFYTRLNSLPSLDFGKENLYKFLITDQNIFRVYCTSACFNTQELSKYKIQILSGENPIQQKNFIEFLQQAGNYNWNKFSVIFPPYQIWQTPNPPVPSAELLGIANVRYVASTYELKSNNYTPEGTFNNVYLYKNNKYFPRSYFLQTSDIVKIDKYSPNDIKLTFATADIPRTLIFSENYYPGWNAYIQNVKLPVTKWGVFRQINVPAYYQDLELKFQPQSFSLGKTVTLTTIIFLVLYYLHTHRQKKYG